MMFLRGSTPRIQALLTALFVLAVCVFFSSRAGNLTDTMGQIVIETPSAERRSPKMILGFSTGHVGSRTVHDVVAKATCPWPKVANFENTAEGERGEAYRTSTTDPCSFTREKLVPFLEDQRTSHGGEPATYVDIGHFHNGLPSGLECLAEIYGSEIAFVRIRRNRHAIANSFGQNFITPCMDGSGGRKNHPVVAYCPRSGQRHGPTVLRVPSDAVWDALSAFQKFLWLADETELRYQAIRQEHPECQYYEISWSTGDELSTELARVWRDELGCHGAGLEQDNVPHRNKNKHVKHGLASQNCSWAVLQDLQYREAIQWTEAQKKDILGPYAQRIGGPECMESNEDLIDLLRTRGEDPEEWALIGLTDGS